MIKNPKSATDLLAQNLPKASNFYISYIIVQGLGIAAGNLLNIGALVMLTFVGLILFFIYFMLPKFKDMFRSFGTELPLPTETAPVADGAAVGSDDDMTWYAGAAR